MIVAGGSNRRVQVRRRRKGGWTKADRARFIATLSETCNVRHASRAVGVNYRSAYRLRDADEGFAAEWADALAAGYERLESELLSRALGEPCPTHDDDRPDDVSPGEAGPVDPVEAGVSAGIEPDHGHAFDPDLALRVLAHRNRVLQAPARRGGPAVKPVPAAMLAASLLRKLDGVARRLAREDALAAQFAARQRVLADETGVLPGSGVLPDIGPTR